MTPTIILNDGETHSSLEGVVVVDHHGIVYNLLELWNKVPITIRESCREGHISELPTLNKYARNLDALWP